MTSTSPAMHRMTGMSAQAYLNLGLRWEYDSNLTGNSSEHDPCPSLTVTPTAPCTWMANIIDLKKTPDTRDFGPRVGFVYGPFGKGNTVIRGGYGIYYDRIILEAGAEELVQNDRALTVTQYGGSSAPHLLCLARLASTYVLRPKPASSPELLRSQPLQWSAPDGRHRNPCHGPGRASPSLPAILARPATTSGERLDHLRGRSARLCITANYRPPAAQHNIHFAIYSLPRQNHPAQSPIRSAESPITSRSFNRRLSPGTTG